MAKKKTKIRYKIQDLHQDDLWKLRTEVVFGSMFISDYRNTFGFSPASVQQFFEGYEQHLIELVKEDGYKSVTAELIDRYDNADQLFDYYWSIQDWDWFDYDPEFTPAEEQAYCDYWNGVKA